MTSRAQILLFSPRDWALESNAPMPNVRRLPPRAGPARRATMKTQLLLLMVVLICTGCAPRREVSPRVKLRPTRATELALHLDVDRGERIFKVTLEYRETETVREDYHLATGDLG